MQPAPKSVDRRASRRETVIVILPHIPIETNVGAMQAVMNVDWSACVGVTPLLASADW